jgi:hypothetical protein
LVSVSIAKLPAVMKSGSTPKRTATLRSRITQANMPEGTLRAILNQAGIAPDDFLNA